jgi:hypothetical protein
MSLGEWVGLVGLILASIGGNFGAIKYFIAKLEVFQKENNEKIGRVFSRFDEYKRDMIEKFVQKDMCKVMHESNADNLSGLETRIEKRFDKLDEQINKLLNKP